MTPDNENTSKLTRRERELTAIGAAIASNCVPCVEYHVALARKVGLSDVQIREAVELADKVRKVPADKVLQTAHSLLQVNDKAEPDAKETPCGCPGTKPVSEESVGRGERKPEAESVCLDNSNSEEENEAKNSDFSKIMEMMWKCCPDKMKDFSSMMNVMGGCPSKEKERPEPSGRTKPAA